MPANTTKKMICLGCPNGCHLTVCPEGDTLIVQDAKCNRGEIYAREEYYEPKRVVTAVVQTDSEITPYLPVKSSAPLLIALIPDLLATLYSMQITLPKRCGDSILENFHNTGVDVLITRTVEK